MKIKAILTGLGLVAAGISLLLLWKAHGVMQPVTSQQYSGIALPAASAGWTSRPVAIYHTHSDESYLPSDGRISIPFRGGIIEVGCNYKNSLTQEGAKAVH
ncbi:MAG: stage II sporulation protein P, partial [Desulfocucumaceae bacterium]